MLEYDELFFWNCVARFFTGDDGIVVLSDNGASAMGSDWSLNGRITDKYVLFRRVPSVLYLLPSILWNFLKN